MRLILRESRLISKKQLHLSVEQCSTEYFLQTNTFHLITNGSSYLCLFFLNFAIFIGILSLYIEKKVIPCFIIITNKVLREKSCPERLNSQDNKTFCVIKKKINTNYNLSSFTTQICL